MTRTEFQEEITELRDEATRICRVGHALPLTASPREVAMFDEMIGALDRRIRFLQIKMNVYMAFSRTESVGHLPSPRHIDIKQTMLNFDRAVRDGTISNHTEA